MVMIYSCLCTFLALKRSGKSNFFFYILSGRVASASHPVRRGTGVYILDVIFMRVFFFLQWKCRIFSVPIDLLSVR